MAEIPLDRKQLRVLLRVVENAMREMTKDSRHADDILALNQIAVMLRAYVR